ncbi:MAG TPA: aminoglycoside phosphotransferase family protein [Puia sp.]|nr:aminoglycoside phosphotransferase family protein [Puia sp.]
MFPRILEAYGLPEDQCSIRPFGTGLINHTWKVSYGSTSYILQRINDAVFHQPSLIAENMESLALYLQTHHPEYLFVKPLNTLDGRNLVQSREGYFRLVPFIKGSHTIDVVSAADQAYQAARQFGKFTRLLAGFPIGHLHLTLPDFHNLSLRYRQFEDALQHGNPDRITATSHYIDILRSFRDIVHTFEDIRRHSGFRLRVTHHDTKISNVLFNDAGHGLCVIDLDTVMPGYFISDLGDMMRTYLSPVSEEEKDMDRIAIRDEYFRAIVHGYLSEMKDELSSVEMDHIVYAGKFMIYMQALRFLTDHLNDDRYYGAKYEGHNLFRAINQLTLLQRLAEKEPILDKMVQESTYSF